MLQLVPILKTLWRSRIGPLLIVVQLALTIAIISNTLFFIQSRLDRITQPTGLADQHIAKLWVKENVTVPGLAQEAGLVQSVERDVEQLRSLPGIRAVAAIGTSIPFSHSGYSSGFYNKHKNDGDDGKFRVQAGVLEADHRALDALGLRLVAGRNFFAEEIIYYVRTDTPARAQAIITQSVAEQAFPGAYAVGKTLYMAGQIPLTVVGVAEDFLGYFPNLEFGRNNVLISAIEKNGSINYVLNGDEEALDRQLFAAAQLLRRLDAQRIVGNEITLAAMIRAHYRSDYAMVFLLVVITALLAFINMLGIVGITTFWVNQRRRHIGIRRALGATRAAIIQSFILENALLVVVANGVGAIIALWASQQLVQRYAFEQLPWVYLPVAGFAVLVVTMAAAALPAYRAAQLPPREALASR